MVSLREKPMSSVEKARSSGLPQWTAAIRSLMSMIFFIWLSQKTENPFHVLNGCPTERSGLKAASPDLVLYVGEVGDTTIATDLDEKKQLYAAIGIPEYWVVDVKGSRVLAFRLDKSDRYQQIETSIALEGLPIALLDRALADLNSGLSNGAAAQGFGRSIVNLGVCGVKP